MCAVYDSDKDMPSLVDWLKQAAAKPNQTWKVWSARNGKWKSAFVSVSPRIKILPNTQSQSM